MTIEQAQARAKQLNSRIHLKQVEGRRLFFEKQKAELDLKFMAAIPELYKQEFEQKYIFGRFDDPVWRKRFLYRWKAVQKMLVEIQLDPADWYDEMFRFYDYFYKHKFSFSYLQKLLMLTNLWGYFLSRKMGQTFVRIPFPRGKERTRLSEAYRQKRGQEVCASEPLTPDQLERVHGKINQENYNWLYLSVWLGLRPIEIDQLHDLKMYRVLPISGKSAMLWVYQTKLVAMPERYRWKLIPLIFKGQKNVLKIIKQGNFKRPLTKTVHHHFGAYTTLYGGRKGFTDLMLSYQQRLENISQWMGHSSIERTWKSYKSRRVAHFD